MVASSIAAMLDALVLRLAALGRLDDALAVSEEAVAVYRELAADRPDEYRPGLAGALGIQAAILGSLEREDAAAVAHAEAAAGAAPGSGRIARSPGSE
jgi:hypothetical protein